MKTVSILLVDDDAEDRELMRDALAEQGTPHVLAVAEDGEKALELLAGFEGLPHLIIMDLNMPKLSGPQTIEKIRQQPLFGAIRIVVLSTSHNPMEKEKLAQFGVNHYLTKPVTVRESQEIAQKLMELAGAYE